MCINRLDCAYHEFDLGQPRTLNFYPGEVFNGWVTFVIAVCE